MEDFVRFPIKPTDASAVSAVLNRHAARVYRIAACLTDDPAGVSSVADRVLNVAVKRVARWRTDDEVERWLCHYTVLVGREVTPTPPLVATNEILDIVRRLPPRQREAFLLHHALGMDLRRMSTAMDCSSTAASNHLVAATEAVRETTGDRLNRVTAALPTWVAARVPPIHDIPVLLETRVRRTIRAARWRRIARVTAIVIITASVIAAAVWWRRPF